MGVLCSNQYKSQTVCYMLSLKLSYFLSQQWDWDFKTSNMWTYL